MVTFVPAFVNTACRDWSMRLKEAAREAGIGLDHADADRFATRYAERDPRPRARIDDVVAHVEHVREVAGIDHVGLGGDYDGVDQLPEGLEDVTGYPRLLAALAERGWSPTDLAALAGGNALRVMGDAGLR
jgi:membrane dipeptidase